MTPTIEPAISRRAGRIIGGSDLPLDERDRLVKALEGAQTWSDIPDEARHRLEQLEAMADIPDVSRGIQSSPG